MVKKFMWSLVGVVVAGMVVPSGSWGQAAKGMRGGTGPVEIEEITVTAQKREESIQETPISVMAITGDALTEKGISSVTDLQQSVPNMRLSGGTTGESTITIGMRGTANGEISMTAQPTVGLHVDGFYIAHTFGANMDLEDLERVEVLRGPQGTLFGRNTSGGAINIVTKKPTQERSITVSTEVGNYDAFKGRVTVNVPLIGKNGYFQSDALGTLSLRENAVYRSHEPYVDNKSPTNVPTSGAAGLSNLNRVSNLTALRWQPTKDVTVDYSFEYHRYREAPSATQVTHIYPGGPSSLIPYMRDQRVDSLGNNAVFSNDLSLHRLTDDGNHRMQLLTLAWDLGEVPGLGSVTLKSISGYRSMTTDNQNDQDGSPLHVGDFHLHVNLDTWSEEVQVIGTAPRVRYVLGAYYYGEHNTEESRQVLLNATDNFHYVDKGTDASLAPFGQITVTPPILNDKLSITAGVRYTYESVSVNKDFLCVRAGLPGVPVNFCNRGIAGLNNFNSTVTKSYGAHGTGLPALSPMANIAYQWTDSTMTYFRASRGYQSGGVNGRATDPRLFNTFDPEKLLAFEGGVKSQWFDNRLRLNADGFLSEYTDQVVQVFMSSPTGGVETINQNAGASEFWGFELEAVALPLRGVEASLNYSYLNSRYLKWSAQKQDANGPVFTGPNNDIPVMENVANLRDVPLAPDHNISVGLTYTAPPTTAGVFSAHIDGYWQDSVVNHPVRPQPDMEGNYAVFNGRLQFVAIPLQKGSLDLALYGHNLLNRQYRAFGYDLGDPKVNGLGWSVNAFGDPRTFGVQLTYNFTES
jgi:iron complex outermembrane receptor protein